ncbi:MAG: hypothetical protein RIG61_00520 [Deltaproteobacteria bacterium]
MKNKITLSLILTAFSIALNHAYAVPPPCTTEELLKSSDYAVEGTVMKIECGEPYDSEECKPLDESSGNFVPELVAKCMATVKVTKNIKGGYEAGSEAPVPFLKIAQDCENGSHIIPGSPTKDLAVNSNIEYYNSELCRYWNLKEPAPQTPGPGNSDESADKKPE